MTYLVDMRQLAKIPPRRWSLPSALAVKRMDGEE